MQSCTIPATPVSRTAYTHLVHRGRPQFGPREGLASVTTNSNVARSAMKEILLVRPAGPAPIRPGRPALYGLTSRGLLNLHQILASLRNGCPPPAVQTPHILRAVGIDGGGRNGLVRQVKGWASSTEVVAVRRRSCRVNRWPISLCLPGLLTPRRSARVGPRFRLTAEGVLR